MATICETSLVEFIALELQKSVTEYLIDRFAGLTDPKRLPKKSQICKINFEFTSSEEMKAISKLDAAHDTVSRNLLSSPFRKSFGQRGFKNKKKERPVYVSLPRRLS